MDIKREVKLFWSSHSDAFLFYAIVLISIILIVQGLNKLAEQEQQNKEKNVVQSEIVNEITNKITITEEDDNINKQIINEFINYCKEERIEEAYRLLANDCKNEKYPNIDSFKELYYNKIFDQKRNVEVDIVEDNIYKVTFLEDMLESGKIDDRNNIVDYYKIETAVLENNLTIYINLKSSIE